MTKKSLSAKIFFSVITKNSNKEILPKNLVKMVLRTKNYFWGSLKDLTFRGGDLEKQIYRGRFPKKGKGVLDSLLV